MLTDIRRLPRLCGAWTCALLMAGFGAAAAAPARPSHSSREIVPLHEVRLSDGSKRYTVTLRIGSSAPIEALLDTSSTGLRVVNRALTAADYSATDTETIFVDAEGEQVAGPLVKGRVRLGRRAADLPLQLVKGVACLESRPHCPGAGAADDRFTLGGPRQEGGFLAILGIQSLQPRPGAAEDNPLLDLGAEQWIVSLPDAGKHGELVLDPTPTEISGFQRFSLPPPTGGGATPFVEHLELPGCLEQKPEVAVCGPVELSTAFSGIRVLAPPSWSWRAGRSTELRFSSKAGEMRKRFPADRADGKVTAIAATPSQGARLAIGVLAYELFDVLSDTRSRSIGLRPRDPAGHSGPAPTKTAANTTGRCGSMGRPSCNHNPQVQN